MPYKVLVDDNFLYMDEDERYEHGTFATSEEAVAACMRMVDADLEHMRKPGMTADELYDLYVGFGRDPFIRTTAGEERPDFSAWNYAKERCAEIAAAAPSGNNAADRPRAKDPG